MGFNLKKRWGIFKSAFSSGAGKLTGRKSKSDAKKQEGFEVDDAIIWQFARTDPLINSAKNVLVDNVVPSFSFEMLEDSAEAEAEKESMEGLAITDNWMQRKRNVAANLAVFDDCFQEMIPTVDGEVMGKTAIIDTKTVKIILEDDGEVKEYQQWIEGKLVATLKPEEIVHYRLNVFGDRDYGLSNLEPVLFSAAAKRFAERFNAAVFQNHKPRGWWNFPSTMSKETYDEAVDLMIEAKSSPQKDLYLRGVDGLSFNEFVKQDAEFIKQLEYVRQEILTGMGVPPILLGLPEGSNRASADIEMQGFDRRVKSMQSVIEYEVNQRIVKEKMGFTKVRFKLDQPNKRDTIQELDIANKMMGFATLNEIRKEVGLSELDVKEYPDADQILKPQSPAQPEAPQGNNREETEKKTVKKNANLITKKDEDMIAGLLTTWAEDVKKKLKKEITANKHFFSKLRKTVKAINDPNDLLKKVLAVVTVEGLKTDLNQMLISGYAKGIDSMAKELNRQFSPDSEALEFLKTYTFDLVRGMSDRLKNNLRRVLRSAVISGQSIPTVKKLIDSEVSREVGNSETLARTELNRASNNARLQAAKDSGVIEKKWISITRDARTSDISLAIGSKYGSPEQAIPIDETFKVRVRGKTIEGQAPPFHPNERDAIMFITK